MYIKKVEVKNFRNYEHEVINFNKNINLIIGDNAQGKTNLIESIYLSAVGKSFRTLKDAELIKFDSDFAVIKTDYFKENEDNKLEIIINKNQKKSAKLNGLNLTKISQLLENIFVVVFSPEDLKIIKDEPEKRRKFINIEMCKLKPSYYSNLKNYKKILLQRNTYLKEEKIDKKVLNVWDEELAKYGSRLMHQRIDYIKKINKISNKIHQEITNNKENLNIKYMSNVKFVNDLKEQEKEFLKEINETFENDIKQRTTTKGPHKDDIEFIINEINVRKFGSQGQQRTAALAIKLAELNLIKEETSENAILLLDDVMSELDNDRQEYLIKALNEVQLFITTTNISETLMEKFQNKNVFYVKNGKIEDIKKC